MELGFSPDSFWRQTPRTVALAAAGRARALDREQRERAWLAWHTAVLPLLKKFPKLTDLLGQPKPRRKARAKRAPAERLWAIARAWTAAEGGRLEG